MSGGAAPAVLAPRPHPLVPLAVAMMALAGVAGYVAYGIGRDIAGPAADVIGRPTAVVVDANSPSARAVASQMGSEPLALTPAAAAAQPAQPAVSAGAVAASSPIPVATAPVGIGSAAPGTSAATTSSGVPPTVPAAAPAGEAAPAAALAGAVLPGPASGSGSTAAGPATSASSAAAASSASGGAPPQPAGAVQLSQAIKLGQPLKLAGSTDTLVLLATNATERPLGFTARAEIRRGGAVVVTATGGLPAVPPGQTRVLSLKSESPIPAAFDTASLRVDSIADPPPGATASPIALGQPRLTRPAPPVGEVTATNTGTTPRAFTIQAAFAKGDRLVGLVTAPVGSLAPGQSYTVALNSPSDAAADALYAVVESVRD